jgi:single-stranded DNA-binding protein
MAPGRETGSIDVSTFGAAGEAAARTLSKGWIVAVDGRLEYALGRPTTGRPVTATR